jgi:glycosyltransferase involved in cell wall biosynthesis
MTQKIFLVVIPAFNKAETIKRSIQSVLDQNILCDILVINDGSTDRTAEELNSISQKKVMVVHQENRGVSYSRNEGIRYAIKHNYNHIAFLDADDYWLDNHLKQIAELIHLYPEADLYANSYQFKVSNSKWNFTKYSHIKQQKPHLLVPFFKFNYLNSILSSSSFCMKVDPTNLLFYNEKITHTEDTDFLIRAGIHKKIAFHPVPAVVIDQTSSNRSHEVPLENRVITNFNIYEEQHAQVIGLKKYLDINRFSVAISYRLANDIKNATIYQHKIDLRNLSVKQKQLLKMNNRQLKYLKKTQEILGNLGFRLRTGG